MDSASTRRRLQEAGLTAYRAAMLTGALIIILGMFIGMAYLVYMERMSPDLLVLYSGVILGYVLNSLRDFT